MLGYLLYHVVRWYDDFEAGKTDDIILLRTGMVVLKDKHDYV